MKKSCFLLMFIFVVVGHFCFIITPVSVWSATFNVASVTEFQDALTTAQQNGEDDTIFASAGAYDVSGGTLTYVAKTTVPQENFALTISGAGAGQTFIDGGNSAQCLSITTYSGGFDDSAATITVRGITFQNGMAAYRGVVFSGTGGGAYIFTMNGNITIEDSAFEANGATYDGAGMFARAEGTGTILVSGIAASNNISGGDGSGAWALARENNVTILDSVFINNTVTGANTGGGLFAKAGTGGTVTVIGCIFIGNEALATDAIAGGAYTESWSNGATIFVNNTLNGNSSNYGGGAYFNGGPMTVANNTLSGNHAAFNGGGMLFEMQGGTAEISNNVVWGNTAAGEGADIRIGDGIVSHIAVLRYNNYSELASVGGGSVTEETTNVNLDPRFVSTSNPLPANWNLHLTKDSPCIDIGSNALISSGTTTDRDGDRRIVDGDKEGTATVDMGSDEYNPSDTNSGGGGGGGGCFIGTTANGS